MEPTSLAEILSDLVFVIIINYKHSDSFDGSVDLFESMLQKIAGPKEQPLRLILLDFVYILGPLKMIHASFGGSSTVNKSHVRTQTNNRLIPLTSIVSKA